MHGRNYYCWFSFLTLLLVAVGEPAARGYTHGQEVGFDLYRDYLIVGRGSAGALKGLNFLLDTGATPTVLDRRLAQKLHLEELPETIAVLEGSVQGGRAVVPTLEFGPMRRDNLPIIVEDLSFFQKTMPVHIDAIIGLDVLGQSAFEIDYNSREIRFDKVPALTNSLSLHVPAGLPIVEAEVNGVSVHLLVDTGASSLILFEPAGPKPATAMKISAVKRSPDTIGDFERNQVRLQSLRLGGAEFGKEAAFLVRSGGDHSQGFDGLMSPVALGITKLAVDVERGVLTFSR